MGDICKDLTILKKADNEENLKEAIKEDSKLHIVKFKRSKLTASVVGAYSVSRNLSFDNLDLPNRISSEGYPLGTVIPKTEQ